LNEAFLDDRPNYVEGKTIIVEQMRTAEEIMQNNGQFNSGHTINVIDDQQN